MIRRLRFWNFGPFRGEHTIDLGPGAYAFVARSESDPKRSNAVGKSILLEAIQYAVTGHLNKNRPEIRERGTDGWITNGEREGGVFLEVEGGAWIERSKAVGKPRQVRARITKAIAAQDAAHEEFLSFLSFGEEDYSRISYFEQKKASALLQADPSERLAVITGWLGLDLADRAEKRAGEIASERWAALEKLEAKRTAHVLPTIEEAPSDDELRKEAEEHRAKIAELRTAYDRIQEVERARKTIREYEAVVEQGKACRKRFEAIEALETSSDEEIEALEGEHDKALAALATASNERTSRQRVALGVFDGRCPLTDAIQCPAKIAINSDRGAARTALERAKTEHEKAAKKAEDVRGRLSRARVSAKDRATVETELKRLRKQAKDLQPEVEKATALVEATQADASASETWARIEAINERVIDIDSTIKARERARAHARQIEELRVSLEVEGGKLAASHRVAHRTREIFRLARRRVAERAIADIEFEANSAIASAGVDLRLGVRWEREGKKPAIECSECGAPFPASARVKECSKCGSPRGMHSIPRLDFLLSASSGGFDDLAGVALQLSAGAWLLAKRQSPWATAILDEPTSAMDPAIRRSLVRYLAAMSARTYRQILVVSHSSDFVDAIPNRITVVQKRNGDREIVS